MPARDGVRRLGQRWEATYRTPAGKERKRTFDRQRDAVAWRDENRSAVRAGTWRDPRRGHVPLRTYADDWLKVRTDLRPTTRSKYRRLLDSHILPALGDTHPDGLDAPTVRSWHYGEKAKRPASAADAYRLLSAIFHTAIDDDMLSGPSPCRVKGGGADPARERPVASMREVEAAMAATAPEHRPVIALASFCSLRRGEIAGLRRHDVDEVHSVIQVRRATIVTSQGETLTGKPKTASGVRDVSVPPHVMALLVEHLRDFVGPESTAPLFGPGGSPLTPRSIDRTWERARRAIGRPDLTLHDLRHSGLTWAAQAGATTAELMHRGGHASLVAAVRYQHATQERDRALAQRMTDLASDGHNDGSVEDPVPESVADFSRTSAPTTLKSMPPTAQSGG